MGAMSKLQAVNRMLRAAGEYPVNSLTDDGVNDTNVAEDLLDEISLHFQMEGLLVNTIYQELTPDTDGRILLPDGLLEVEPWGYSRSANVCQRGKNPTYLYDLDDNTDEFDDTIYLRLVVEIIFEELPTAIQFAVADLAAQFYQKQTVGDDRMDDALGELANFSRTLGRASDIRTKNRNLFRGQSETARSAAKRLQNRRW